jgi:tRNA A-37 threonylcarbamoyl transferase component Bud32
MTAHADHNRTAEPAGGSERSRFVVANTYEIDLRRPLGSGGMSIVYLGRDLKARRTVALRTLRPEYRRDPVTRNRFRQESRRMALVQHPNVARVFDYKEDDDAPWAVIEYVPGKSLRDLVERDGPQPLGDVTTYLIQISEALAAIHQQGLVHLDVKPHNIIVTDDGTIKLIDFGLAQPARSPQELIGGMAYGTAAYLSPEQASGGPVEPASDVYSLGCVIYELLTGQPPFRGSQNGERPNEVIRAHLQRRPVPPSRANPEARIPTWVDELVLWALEKRPEDRYDDVRRFALLFAEGLEGTLSADSARSMRATTAPIDTHLVPEPRQSGGRPDSAGLSQPLRGRVAKSLARGRLPRRLWRLVFALLAANAILAAVLYFQRGTIPGLYDGSYALQPGSAATVTANGLNVRSDPGVGGIIVGTLVDGDRVELTGDAVAADGERWWPVEINTSAGSVTGYVWEGGLQPDLVTGRDRLERVIDRAREWVERETRLG